MRVNADFVAGAVEGVLDRFYNEELERTEYFYAEEIEEEDIEIEHYLEDEMGLMLDSLGIQNSVERVWVDEDNTRTCYALCIAYVIDCKLYARNEAVYG